MRFSEVALGQYYPAESMIHKLDPRSKLLIASSLIVGIFFVSRLEGLAGFAVIICLMAILAQVPLGYLMRSLRPLLIVIVLTFVVNALFTPGRLSRRSGSSPSPAKAYSAVCS